GNKLAAHPYQPTECRVKKRYRLCEREAANEHCVQPGGEINSASAILRYMTFHAFQAVINPCSATSGSAKAAIIIDNLDAVRSQIAQQRFRNIVRLFQTRHVV